jgi:glycerol dehydrogenase-like iron-containing ADH family enzyme
MTKKELKVIDKVAKTVSKNDLYHALHMVGDDPVKSIIQDTLKEVLTKKDFDKVVAVFKLITDDDVYNKYFGEDGKVL